MVKVRIFNYRVALYKLIGGNGFSKPHTGARNHTHAVYSWSRISECYHGIIGSGWKTPRGKGICSLVRSYGKGIALQETDERSPTNPERCREGGRVSADGGR